MTYDIAIFGSGISAKILCLALAKNNFKVFLISDITKQKNDHPNNLVTFLSSGSIAYLQTIFSNHKIFDKFIEIKTINCELEGVSKHKNQSIIFNDKKNDILGKIVMNSFFEECLDKEIEKYKNIWCSETSGIEKTSNLKHKILLKLEDGTEIYSKVFALSSTKNQKIIDNLNIKFIKQDFMQDALSVSVDVDLKRMKLLFKNLQLMVR